MFLIRNSVLLVACAIATFASAQVVTVPAAKTIKNSKAEVVSLAIAPKGDRILVGLNDGAELYDIESGKKVGTYPFNEDDGTAVYHVGFNENGEKVVLIGHSGKRAVWNVKAGKREMVLRDNLWIPTYQDATRMGLVGKNSNFDRFYQQSEATIGDYTVRTGKDGVIEFMDTENKVVQTIEFPENKDQHHRAPLLVWDEWFITGTDDGQVLFYALPK